MTADGLPSLPAFSRSVEQDVGDRGALLTARAEARHDGVPDDLARLKGPNLAQTDPLSARPSLRLRFC